ncbi:LuxR C-terminal-related transcriptional regulator [Govanella unica]|uniref:LuxR C-terminal-related transcriptional regulator n=1 Tax=Govanella unica TaxID=2975056 RepID=A0A9X3TYR1_9PROT|nr:LuxR C-terminal-related transcriptional regulator [Govania unica]MDA5194157.1 LuxR C-terminal-related transcriptional regulator [Govania unica]
MPPVVGADLSNHRQSWLTRAKLEAPRQQIALIDRPRLLTVLEHALTRRLCLVAAPAGFGKTTLLAQWRAELIKRDMSVAWLTLDEDDNETRQFLCYVIFSLSAAGVDTGRLLGLAEQGLLETPLQAALAATLEAIAQSPRHVVLMLDDYHRAETDEINNLLKRLVDNGPDNFTLIVNSRLRPTRSITQSLASGHAMEIGPESLRFSMAETRAAFDPLVSDSQLEMLFLRTEGWAMAIQLARLASAGDRAEGQVFGEFRGQSGLLASYLAEQVLTRLPEELQNFLMFSSICERFTASLANALTEREDAWDLLQQLEPLRALLVPLDGEWFRYHHLFADYLRDSLKRRHPSELKPLHLRASRWFEQNGLVPDAVRHARLAEDYDRCARLIENAGAWELILFGGIGYLSNLLRNIPDREMARFPRIQVARAYLAIKQGQILEGRRYLEDALANPTTAQAQADSTQGLGRDLLNVTAMQEVYEDRWTDEASLDRITRMINTTPDTDAVSRGVLLCSKIINYLALGRLEDAQETCQVATRAMRQGNSVLGINYCYLHSGIIALYGGKLRLAEANLWETQRMAEENFGADSGLKALADIMLNSQLFWAGEWKEDNFEKFQDALQYAELYDGWFEIFATALDVEMSAALLRQNLDAADTAIDRTQQLVDTRGGQRLGKIVEACRLAVALARQDDSTTRALAERLEASFPLECWKSQPQLWRPYQTVAPLLGLWTAQRDRARGLRILDDLVACCEHIRSDFYLIRALIARAQLLDLSGQRPAALTDLLSALTIAAPEKIRMPFRLARGLHPLLHAAQKKAREDGTDLVIMRFISTCLESATGADQRLAQAEAANIFSTREYEVLLELTHGHSNKEIARTLDLTEHTVKFHLRNIFVKLKVDKRTDAIAAATRLKLVPDTTRF